MTITDYKPDIQIYVACLASYNDGVLHGEWIRADQDADDIRQAVADMLAGSTADNAEEWAIHDHSGFEGVSIGESASFEHVAELAAFIAQYRAIGGALVQHFGSLEDAREAMEERYCGQYRTLSDFAHDMTTETTEIPETLRHYIDWDAMARDLAVNDVLAIETGFECVHVFWQR